MADDWAVVSHEPSAPASSAPADPWAVVSHDDSGKSFSVSSTLKQYFDKVNPVTQAQGLAETARHPGLAMNAYGETNAKLAHAVAESFKSGHYSEAVRHSLSYMLQAVPGLGAALDEAGNKAGSGDYEGAIADTAALATNLVMGKVGPKVLDAATEPGVVPTPSDAGRAAVAAVKAGAPDVAAGAGKMAVGGAVDAAIEATGIPGASYVAHGAGIGGGLAGALQIGRGIKSGFKAGVESMNESLAPAKASVSTEVAPSAPPPLPGPSLDEIAKGLGAKDFESATAQQQTMAKEAWGKINGTATAANAPAAPQAPSPLPESHQLGAAPAKPLITPAPPDTSGVIKEWKPTILEKEPAEVAPKKVITIRSIDELIDAMRTKLEQRGAVEPGYKWNAPPKNPRWDEGSPTNTIKADMPQTKILKPAQTAMVSPKAINLAQQLVNELAKKKKAK